MIRSDRSEGIAFITLDRPERRNALGAELVRSMSALLRHYDADEAVKAVVITGSPPAFCAGSDLKELASLSVAGMCDHEATTAAMVRSIAAMSKPVIAAVEGYALGGGFMLAVGCDIVVSGIGAIWHLPEATNGWIPIWGLRALTGRVGPSRAQQLSWGATKMNGAQAQESGVVDHVAADGEALARAVELASELASLPPEAVRSIKAFFHQPDLEAAERWDRLACEAFAHDSASKAAQATFERYR